MRHSVEILRRTVVRVGVLSVAVLGLSGSQVWAQALPHVFQPNTPAKASEVNENFAAVAINRTVMLCGTSSREVSQFIPAYPMIGLTNGCSPTPDTLAMLVARSGIGNVLASELKTYLEQGGIVLGEFSNNDELYNLAFDEGVVQGVFTGNCADRVNPDVRLNPNDPIWKAVDFVAPVASGCGYDMQAFPNITAVGGWTTAGSVSIAYRELGEGRLWLVELDWQDNSTRDQYDQTRTIMKYMLSHK